MSLRLELSHAPVPLIKPRDTKEGQEVVDLAAAPETPWKICFDQIVINKIY